MAGSMEVARSLAILMMAGLLATILAPGVLAVTAVSLESGLREIVVVPEDGFQAYSVTLSDEEGLRVDVRSTAGFLMDVYVLNSTNFLDYVRDSPSFEWIAGPSAENAILLLVDFRPTRDGNYYVVVDNRLLSPSGAVPVGPLEASVSLGPPLATVEPSWTAVLVLVGIGLGFLVLLSATFVRPGWHEGPWIRKSWTGPVPSPRMVPNPSGTYNEFRDTPPRP